MTAEHDLARLAARALRRHSDEQRPPPADRDRGISIVAHAMAERARRKRTVRWVLGLAGALGTLALAGALPFIVQNSSLGLPPPACSGVCTSVAGAPSLGTAGASSFPPGSRIRAGDAPLSVSFGESINVHLSAGTEVVYAYDAGVRRFRLVGGSVEMDVERLEPSQRFIVETADAEVEVRGTRFFVSWLAPAVDCVSRTRVDVSEGVVEVRSQDAVHALMAGKSWLGECRRPPVPASRSSALSPPKSALSPAKQRRSEQREVPVSGEPSAVPSAIDRAKALASSLSLQNELYGRAIAARRAGQLALALSLHEQLIQHYPAGPLVESALIERVRILASADKTRASAEARRYLERFPHGFARDEARSVAAP